MTNMFYEKLRSQYGISYNTTASVRKFACPRCGFEFSLAYARAIACQGCSEAVKDCKKVRCAKCDYEWRLADTPDVQDKIQENTLAEHICDIVNKRDDGRGIVVFNR